MNSGSTSSPNYNAYDTFDDATNDLSTVETDVCELPTAAPTPGPTPVSTENPKPAPTDMITPAPIDNRTPTLNV